MKERVHLNCNCFVSYGSIQNPSVLDTITSTIIGCFCVHFSIGSLGKDSQEEGIQNITVKTVVFTGTQNGLRIKSWARPNYGFVKGVLFEQAVMQKVSNPIIIDQNYCPSNENCPNKVITVDSYA